MNVETINGSKSGLDGEARALPIPSGAALLSASAPTLDAMLTSHFPQSLSACPSGPRSIFDWVTEIKQAWSHTPASVLYLARLVTQAKETLPYGQWSRLCDSRGLPFRKRKAEYLVVIGRNLGKADAQTFAHLPVAWTTLYYLARLGLSTVNLLIGQARIHPNLTLGEARELLAQFDPGSVKKNLHSSMQRRVARFDSFVRENVTNWSLAEIELFQTQLRAWHELVGTRSTASPTSASLN